MGADRGRRIVIVEVNWIGDVLFSTPFIRAVREANPDAYIACLLHPRCREVLESNPRVNEIIFYDEERAHRGIIGKMRLVHGLRRRRFDTAFILHRSFTKAFLTYLAGIPERIGYATKRRGGVLTKAVEEPPADLHKVDYFLRLAEAAGIAPGSRSYEFFVTEDDRRAVRELLAAKGIAAAERVIVINPGGNWDPKRWPKENFAWLADKAADRFNARIVISGAQKDIGLAEDIRNLMRIEPVIVAGATTLRQLGALMERASLVVANDSGPMHLAVAAGAKVIALFGPTSPAITGPCGEGAYTVLFKNSACDVPCYNPACADRACMAAITVDDVMAAAGKVLG